MPFEQSGIKIGPSLIPMVRIENMPDPLSVYRIVWDKSGKYFVHILSHGASKWLYLNINCILFRSTNPQDWEKADATRVPFQMTMDLMWQWVDDFILVDDAEIDRAMRLLAELAKLVAEGSGAVSLAAALQMRERLRGKKVVGILTGGNVPSAHLAHLLVSRQS